MPRKIDAMHAAYGATPGKCCAECCNIVKVRAGRVYYKCAWYGKSSSEASDWRLHYAACGKFGVPYGGETTLVEQRKHAPRLRLDKPAEGQVGGMKMKYTNLIFAKHDGQWKNYLFRLPLSASVKSETQLHVSTIRGNCDAVAVSDSFILPSEQARQLAECVGGRWPLSRVLGIVKIERQVQFFLEQRDADENALEDMPF